MPTFSLHLLWAFMEPQQQVTFSVPPPERAVALQAFLKTSTLPAVFRQMQAETLSFPSRASDREYISPPICYQRTGQLILGRLQYRWCANHQQDASECRRNRKNICLRPGTCGLSFSLFSYSHTSPRFPLSRVRKSPGSSLLVPNARVVPAKTFVSYPSSRPTALETVSWSNNLPKGRPVTHRCPALLL